MRPYASDQSFSGASAHAGCRPSCRLRAVRRGGPQGGRRSRGRQPVQPLARGPRGDRSAAGDHPYSPEVYERARENFRALQGDGILVRERAPCVYLYRQQMGGHSQTGVAALCHIDDYERDIIKKHEKTRKDKEDDRTRLIDTISADTGPVFLTYRDDAGIQAFVKERAADPALFDFAAPDGIRHTVWRVEDEPASLFGNVPAAYVADGHHRTASAVRVGRERRAKNPNHTGMENYNWFLAVLFPANELKILPYNRTVRDLNGRDAAQFLDAVRADFEVRENVSPEPPGP